MRFDIVLTFIIVIALTIGGFWLIDKAGWVGLIITLPAWWYLFNFMDSRKDKD